MTARNTKILHLITLSVVGGSQDNTFGTAALHDRGRFEVHVAANPDGAWHDRARQCADRFHPLPSLVTPISPWKDLRSLWDIFRLIRREKFTIVHTHTAKAGFLGRVGAALAGVPIVVHTYHAFPFHNYMSTWKRWIYVALERSARLLTHHFITLSHADKKAGAAQCILREGDADVVYTGIDFAKLDVARSRDTVRRALGIQEDWQVVLFVGRLEPQKAPELLIEAFARVVKKCPKTLLLIAGDGELRGRVEAMIRALNLERNVYLPGFRRDIPDLIEAADVFAFSSLWEAMGRAMVEAMLLGKPVVVPRIYGIPEIVRHNETGWLYEVGNAEQLAAGMVRLLNDAPLRARLGANARELTRRLFDIRHMVAQIEHIYDGLLAERLPVRNQTWTAPKPPMTGHRTGLGITATPSP